LVYGLYSFVDLVILVLVLVILGIVGFLFFGIMGPVNYGILYGILRMWYIGTAHKFAWNFWTTWWNVLI